MKYLCLSLLFGSTLFGALPPLAQSIREMQAILGDSQMQKLLGSGESIQEMIRIETGYAVITTRYILHVDVEYQKPKFPGPIPFALHFYDPIEKRS